MPNISEDNACANGGEDDQGNDFYPRPNAYVLDLGNSLSFVQVGVITWLNLLDVPIELLCLELWEVGHAMTSDWK